MFNLFSIPFHWNNVTRCKAHWKSGQKKKVWSEHRQTNHHFSHFIAKEWLRVNGTEIMLRKKMASEIREREKMRTDWNGHDFSKEKATWRIIITRQSHNTLNDSSSLSLSRSHTEKSRSVAFLPKMKTKIPHILNCK